MGEQEYNENTNGTPIDENIIASDTTTVIPAVEYRHSDRYQQVPPAPVPEMPEFPECPTTQAAPCELPTMEDTTATVNPIDPAVQRRHEDESATKREPIAFNGFAVMAIAILPVALILSAIFPDHMIVTSFALGIVASLFSAISAYNDNVTSGKPSVLTMIGIGCSALILCLMFSAIIFQLSMVMSAATVLSLLLLPLS